MHGYSQKLRAIRDRYLPPRPRKECRHAATLWRLHYTMAFPSRMTICVLLWTGHFQKYQGRYFAQLKSKYQCRSSLDCTGILSASRIIANSITAPTTAFRMRSSESISVFPTENMKLACYLCVADNSSMPGENSNGSAALPHPCLPQALHRWPGLRLGCACGSCYTISMSVSAPCPTVLPPQK